METILEPRKRDSQQHAVRQRRSAPAFSSQSRTDTFKGPESQRSTSPSMKSAPCPGNSPAASHQATRGSTSRTVTPARLSTDPQHSTRGSASPQGEARRECAGKAERSERRAREDYGWGWVGGVTKPNHAANSPQRPNTPAAAEAVRRHPLPSPPTGNTAPAAARARRATPGANAPPSASEAKRAAGRITGGGGRAV